METYRNDYKKEEDLMMWELHEARNVTWNDINKKTSDEINIKYNNILKDWKKELVRADK